MSSEKNDPRFAQGRIYLGKKAARLIRPFNFTASWHSNMPQSSLVSPGLFDRRRLMPNAAKSTTGINNEPMLVLLQAILEILILSGRDQDFDVLVFVVDQFLKTFRHHVFEIDPPGDHSLVPLKFACSTISERNTSGLLPTFRKQFHHFPEVLPVIATGTMEAYFFPEERVIGDRDLCNRQTAHDPVIKPLYL